MAYQLRYRYSVGERFAYVTETHTEAQDPGSETRGRKTETADSTWRNDVEVTHAADDGFAFKMVISGQTGQPPQTCTYSHDSLGRIKSEPKDIEQYQRPFELPEDPIEIGESWNAGGLEITLASVDGSVATLKATFDVDVPGQDVDAMVQSTILFSLASGRQLEAKGVTVISFEGDRTVKTVATTRLL